MTKPNPTPTPEQPLPMRRRLPPHLEWRPGVDDDDEDDDQGDHDQDDGEQQNGGDGEHPDNRGTDLTIAPDNLRPALVGRDLRDLSRRSKLPVRLIEHFAAGGALSPGSLLLLVAALRRPAPPRQQIRRWLHDGRNAAAAAAALGLETSDVHAIAVGRVDLGRKQWRKVAALVGDTRC